MLDVASALRLVLDATVAMATQQRPIAEAIEHTLAMDVRADGDAPPFDKAMMDGYAIRAADCGLDCPPLKIIGRITAGDDSQSAVEQGSAVAITTGSAIPPGADAVVMVEQTKLSDDKASVAILEPVRRGQNILRRAAIFKSGDVLFSRGSVINPLHVGLLVEAGSPAVSVYAQPRACVVATGSELCPADQQPRGSQIRNSNGPLLTAMLRAKYCETTDLGIVSDDRQQLASAIAMGLKSDLLVLTGGVSMGEKDLVPGVLRELGVQQVFHKVALKPGKPIWFGIFEKDASRSLVFGLPGNPVSSLVCFQLFVAAAIDAMTQRTPAKPTTAVLKKDHVVRGDRPTYWPGEVANVGCELVASALIWSGSADQRCLATANCLIYFPSGGREYSAGEKVDVFPLSV